MEKCRYGTDLRSTDVREVTLTVRESRCLVCAGARATYVACKLDGILLNNDGKFSKFAVKFG